MELEEKKHTGNEGVDFPSIYHPQNLEPSSQNEMGAHLSNQGPKNCKSSCALEK
jgi:hypothetical protein